MTLEELLKSQASLMREINAEELTYEFENKTIKATLTLKKK